MRIGIYRQKASISAGNLCEALDGNRYRTLDGIERYNTRFPINLRLVCWGEHIPNYTRPALNNVPLQDKLQDAMRLAAENVPTITISAMRPTVQPAVDPAVELIRQIRENQVGQFDWDRMAQWRSPLTLNSLTAAMDAFRELHGVLSQPVPTAPLVEWLGRSRHHVAGNDLFTPPNRPDFYVQKESIAHEYRVHSFLGRSIRAGVKRAVQDGPNHAWIRSLGGGWKISYDGVTIRQRHRDLAHAACQALGLDFGAVDIAERADGSLFVLEVNRAPGLDGGTIDAYAEAIQQWADGRAVTQQVDENVARTA